jgi:1-acyl-sn-glycerol-3-phosphate acyltransferase
MSSRSTGCEIMLSSKLLYWASRPVVGTYTGTMLKMDIRRHTELPAGAKIIAVNHPSTTDPFFIASILGQQCYILIKNVLFQVPVLGAYLHRSGHIPVIAGKGQEAISAGVELLKQGRTVVIFPEGKISPLEGGFHKPRTGVALESGAPIIPVGIHLQRERIHTFRSVVRGQVEYSHWYLRGPYNITVGRPLRFSGSIDNHAQVRSVAESIMHHIIELARESEFRMNHPSAPLAILPQTLLNH